ncbi:hypothetical protein ElyMa_001322600 [Elysia marginata]|uniref:Granulins domain-containing protein n=1 Tax=Elysia marginata TaxID=1093978 RepID=A0AAV4IKL9_9GAST|nr:hypothetical protein ElyMa_001322600 [Elysia marginata]
MGSEREIIATLLLILFICHTCLAFNCKFPNEGCERNEDCCSNKCVDAHPGTNARCTKLGIHKPCLYTYQCEDRLRCGNNSCCARYWGICKHARDCCDKTHHCYEVDGFYYKRCLTAPSLGNGLSSTKQFHHQFFYLVVVTIVKVATTSFPLR